MRLIAAVLLAAIVAIPPARADVLHGTKAEAVAMVQRVETMYKQDGAAATFKAVDNKSNKEFHQGDLYAFIFTLKGVCVAHGAVPALIGKNLINLKDPEGEYTVRVSIAIAEGPGHHGWFEYKWPNPTTHRIQDKMSYIANLGRKYFVGVGVYF